MNTNESISAPLRWNGNEALRKMFSAGLAEVIAIYEALSYMLT